MWKGAVACIGSLCALMACDASAPVLPERVAMLQRALDTALFECADRVWPGSAASYRGSQVLLVSLEAGTAYLWNDRRQAADGRPPRMSLISTAGLDPGWRGTFNVGMLFGTLTLGVSLDDTARFDQALSDAGAPRWHDFAVGFTLHEAFHFIGSQPGWPVAGGGGTRSTPYPQIAQPRYLRAALASSLMTHVRGGGDDAALAAAAFWQGRFVTEHSADAEAIRRTDINEGTAEYAKIAGSALVEHGCAASEATLVQTMLAHLDESVDVASFDAGFESYQLGLLAGIGARLRGDRAAGWEARVELGETPVEVLVSDTAPAAQVDDANLTAGARTAVDASNLAIAAEVTPLLARMASPDHVRLPIPPEWGVGAFGVAGFVNLVDEPGRPEVLLELQATHRMPDGGPMITVQQTVMEIPAAACSASPEAMRIATFPASAAILANGQFTVNSAEVTFSGLPADLVQDAAGLTWMCPRVAASTAAALVVSSDHAPRLAWPPLDCARLRRH